MAKAVKPARRKAVTYSKGLAARICERLVQGESWNSIAKDGTMPSYGAFYKWLGEKPEFAEMVAKARAGSVEYLADRALDVAEAATKETVQESRLLVNTLTERSQRAERKWAAGKVAAAKDAPTIVKKVVFYVRQFERVTGDDGRTYIREIPFEPGTRDATADVTADVTAGVTAEVAGDETGGGS